MGQNWVETETPGCDLGDDRLNRRLWSRFLVRSCVDRLAEDGDATIANGDGAGAIQRHP